MLSNKFLSTLDLAGPNCVGVFCICISDLPQSEPNTHIPNEAVPAPPSVLPHQLNMLGVLRYPVGSMGPRGPSVTVQPAQFAIPTQMPVHLHTAGPPLQMHTMAVQGLPPPPPPPPPVQQGSFTVLPTDPLPQVRDLRCSVVQDLFGPVCISE